MMTEKSVKLKPCPFCGGEAELKKLGVICDEGYAVVCKKCKARTKLTFIEKPGKDVELDSFSRIAKEKLIRQWNVRAGDSNA